MPGLLAVFSLQPVLPLLPKTRVTSPARQTELTLLKGLPHGNKRTDCRSLGHVEILAEAEDMAPDAQQADSSNLNHQHGDGRDLAGLGDDRQRRGI